MYLASIVGRPLSIVTVDEHAVHAAEGFLAQTVRKPQIVSVRSMDVPVRQIVDDRARGAEALEREARLAVSQDGAQAIYLGSMTLGTLGVAERLRADLGVPVFDPIRIVARAALELLVALGSSSAAA
jgi:allantoin racemase